MKNGLIINLELETVVNTNYRRVIYTANSLQLVLMSLLPMEEIGEEIHDLDQFIRIDEGVATVILNDSKPQELTDGYAVLIPAGTKHNIINRSTKPVKLYTLYAPPEHKDQLVEKTKADEHEEHFDGKTTE